MYNYDYESDRLLKKIENILNNYDAFTSSEILFLEEIKNILIGYDENLEFNNKVYVDKDYYYANNCVSLKDVFDIIRIDSFLEVFIDCTVCCFDINNRLGDFYGNRFKCKRVYFKGCLNRLNLEFFDNSTNENINCFFNKDESDNLFISDASKNKNEIEKLFPSIKELIERCYDYCLDFYSISSNEVKSVNSKFLVNFSSLTVYFSGIPEFSLEYENYVFDPSTTIGHPSNIIKSILEHKGDLISDNIFVRIEDCPKFTQKKLLEKAKENNAFNEFSKIKREKNKQQEVEKEEQPKSLIKRLFLFSKKNK